MRSTKFWAVLVALLLVLSVLASFLVLRGRGGTTASVTLNGEVVHTVDLSKVAQGYSFTVTGPAGTNTVQVEPGRIRVSHAQCPDQICVRQGWISTAVVPIVCLPNGLVIQIEDGRESGIDGAAG